MFLCFSIEIEVVVMRAMLLYLFILKYSFANFRKKGQQEKLEILENHKSPLSSIDLKVSSKFQVCSCHLLS